MLPSTHSTVAFCVRDRALGHEVEDVAVPVLDRRVADRRALERDQLDDRRVQRRRRELRRGAALDVVHLRALVGDDQRALELAHVLGVDPEIGLERHRHLDARRHVDERSARPDGRVQRRKLVVAGRNDRREILAHDLGILLDRGIHVAEQHALLVERLARAVIDDLGLVLRRDAGEKLALGLGDAETVERALDVLGHVVPRALRLVGRLHEIVDVGEVDLAQERRIAPRRHRLSDEQVVRFEPELAHPLRLVLHRADPLDDLGRQALIGLEDVVFGVVEPVPVVLDEVRRGDGGLEFDCHGSDERTPATGYSQDS